ncbi:TPA: hypothetical protein KCN18_004146 [Escherichia coli]|nr:hypothetical protein [Escherichia coli]HBB7752689.1 hypothetical protein [Escherichia coli]HBB7832143.1 hypothetical protein [Escherichia coli]HBB7860085.1 hypothetical protein [Escherichia coli]
MRTAALHRIARNVVATFRTLPGPGQWPDDGSITRELADASRYCTLTLDRIDADMRTLDIEFGVIESDGTRHMRGELVGRWDGDHERIIDAQAAYYGQKSTLTVFADVLGEYLHLPVIAGPETAAHEATLRTIREWCPSCAS